MSETVQLEENILPNGFSRRQIAHAITSRVQELILLPTEKCNFRCTYCYEDFELGRMSDELQAAIEKFIDRRTPELDVLNLSWFGGEPLLAKEVILRIGHHAHKLCEEYGVKFMGNMTTNAYNLDIELARELLSINHNFFQITLDGWENTHDVLRRRADGQGTFGVIWKNLLDMHSLHQRFEVCVRIHVRRDNHDNLKILMREFATQFQGDSRFRLDFQHLRDMGGDGGKTVADPVSIEELVGIEAMLRSEYHQALAATQVNAEPTLLKPIGNFGLGVDSKFAKTAGESAGSRRSEEISGDEPYICYAAKPNSLLIRSNGRIGKCTVAFNDERNDLGYIKPDDCTCCWLTTLLVCMYISGR